MCVYIYVNRSRELEGEAAKRPTSSANRSKRYLNSLYTSLRLRSFVLYVVRNLFFSFTLDFIDVVLSSKQEGF